MSGTGLASVFWSSSVKVTNFWIVRIIIRTEIKIRIIIRIV